MTDEYEMLRASYGRRKYDWVDEGGDNCTPEETSYHFSPYYLFRDAPKGQYGIKGTEAYYTDRLRQWDADKADRALKKFTNWRTRPDGDAREICQEAAEIYFGKGVKCVGYAVGGNVGNGFPYGVFYLRDIPKEAKAEIDG